MPIWLVVVKVVAIEKKAVRMRKEYMREQWKWDKEGKREKGKKRQKALAVVEARTTKGGE